MKWQLTDIGTRHTNQEFKTWISSITLIYEANSNFRLSILFFLLLKWNDNFQSRHHYIGTSTLWQMHFLRDYINSYAYGIHPNTTQNVMHLKLVLIFQSKYFHSFGIHEHGGNEIGVGVYLRSPESQLRPKNSFFLYRKINF